MVSGPPLRRPVPSVEHTEKGRDSPRPWKLEAREEDSWPSGSLPGADGGTGVAPHLQTRSCPSWLLGWGEKKLSAEGWAGRNPRAPGHQAEDLPIQTPSQGRPGGRSPPRLSRGSPSPPHWLETLNKQLLSTEANVAWWLLPAAEEQSCWDQMNNYVPQGMEEAREDPPEAGLKDTRGGREAPR